MPDSYCETPDGLLLVANGIQPVLRWDGLTGQMEPAGVQAPATALTLGGSGSGPIVGTYNAYVRFIDNFDHPSDLSPISNDYVPVSASGLVVNVSNTTPIQVTTGLPHGLLNGTNVKIEGVGGATGANTTTTITVVDAFNFTLDGTVGSGDYTGGGTWSAGVATIVYSNLPVPVETKVVRRQILRNTDGQEQTYYVDIDTPNLLSTTLTSTNADAVLQTQEAVPLLNPDNSPAADRYGIPPDWKAVLAAHLDRIFLAGELIYNEGSVLVAFGSTVVQGIGTEWKSGLVGRLLYVTGATQAYLIDAVDEVNQLLTLDTPYLSPSDPFASYGIRPDPGERRLVYYSEAGLPEAWPAGNALSIQEDGDEITGLLPYASFLYILERRHIYRFTFQNNPATDGFVFLSTASRGCINNRCWAVVEDVVYMLDEQGIHGFSGGRDSDPISTPIQDLFRRDGRYAINWSASSFFHAIHYPQEETVRWFVALSGHYLPRHALVFNYRLKRWWIEAYNQPIGASVRARLNNEAVVLLGSSSRRVLWFDQGTLDGVDPSATSVSGTVTGVTLTSLTDAAASFAGVAGSNVTITDGTGKGQTRLITASTGTSLQLGAPWLTLPDATSVYQVGGIAWRFRGAWHRWVSDDQESPRRVEVIYEPARLDSSLLTIQIYLDHSLTPVVWSGSYSLSEGTGVRSQNGSPDLVADLTKPIGFVQKRLDGHREIYVDGPRFVSVQLSGVQNLDQTDIYQVSIDGVR